MVGIALYFWRDKATGATNLQFENMARMVTAVYFSQKYDVRPEELFDTMTVEEMEERAKRIQAESQLAELRGNESGC